MPAPDALREAVSALAAQTGHPFCVSNGPVPDTQLYVVYAAGHPLPAHYTAEQGTLGFRVPGNFPAAGPEDSFFLLPATAKLRDPDPARRSTDIHRVSADPNFLKGIFPADELALVFSWHLWNKREWDRRRHTLLDHYTHCLRRFEQPEHD